MKLDNNSSSNRVLVTGGTGFVGHHVISGLTSSGYVVDAVVREPSNTERLRRLLEPHNLWVVNGETHQLLEIFRRIEPSLVIHCATHFVTAHDAHEVSDLVDSNIKFGLQLVEGMAAVGCKNIINTSSSWQFFGEKENQSANLYAASKTAWTSILKYYQEIGNLSVFDLVLFDTYGPGDWRVKLIPTLIKTARTGEVLKVSPGGQKISLVHIRDVVNAYLLATHRITAAGVCWQQYGISDEIRFSIREVVEMFNEVSPLKAVVEFGARPYRIREIMSPPSGIPVLPGWKPEVTLEAGLREIVA
jgi:nucleoside-diphosphate-sugar epimerase